MALSNIDPADWLTDGKITPGNLARIRMQVESDWSLDFEDVKFLVRLICMADEVCPEFATTFFPLIRRVLLKDGRISPAEQEELVKLINAGGKANAIEKQLLRDLRVEALELTPEFNRLCDAVLGSA